MRLFNKELTITTIKPLDQLRRFVRQPGHKVGMDCAKNTRRHFFKALGGAR